MTPTNEEAINIIWEKLGCYAEHSLDNMIGNGDHDEAVHEQLADEWAEICEAMAHIAEQLGGDK